jgi:hypothetical protein
LGVSIQVILIGQRILAEKNPLTRAEKKTTHQIELNTPDIYFNFLEIIIDYVCVALYGVFGRVMPRLWFESWILDER